MRLPPGFVLIVAALVMAPASGAPSGAATAAADAPVRERNVVQALHAYAAARARGDIEEEVRAFTPDADVWSPLGRRPPARGHGEIRRALGGPPQPFRIDAVYISFPNDNVAVVDAKVFGAETAPNSMATYILVKRKKKWLIRSLRIMPVPAKATLPRSSER